MPDVETAPSSTPWAPDIAAATGPKYQAIAGAIAHDIRQGILPVGSKLPPQRDLAWRLSVTVGTISRAYREAEQRGLIGGEVGRGTYVLSQSGRLRTFGGHTDGGTGMIWSPGDQRMADDQQGPELGPIPMQANVPPPGPAGMALRKTLAEMLDSPALADLLNYDSRNMAQRFREAGVSWLARRELQAGVEDIVVCAGAHNGLVATFATLLKPGQRVMTERLCYSGIKTVAKLLGLVLVPGTIDEEGLCADAVEEAAKAGRIDAVYVVPTLQNPTNTIMGEARREKLAGVCERYDIPLVEDDICGLLIADGPPPITLHAPRMGYYVTSLSKTLAPGLRVGFVKTPNRMRDYVASSVRASTWMASPLTSEIASRWIEGGDADHMVTEQRASLRRRGEIVDQHFGGLTYHKPEGALHVWLDLPPQWDASQFVASAAARDVMLTAAHAFTIGDSPSPRSVRICLGGPRTEQRLSDGLSQLRMILDQEDPMAGEAVM